MVATSTMMVASVLAHTHFNYDGSQRAGLPTSTMMLASVLALPSQQWQPARWLTHCNYDGSQRAGFPSGQWQPASWLPLPVIIKGTCYLYYQVASSHLPAPQLLRALQLYTTPSPVRSHYPLASSPLPDTHALRRGSRGHPAHRTLACISRTRHARSPQRVARGPDKSHSRLHFAHSTRTISAEGRAGSRTNRTLACISRTRGLRAQPANRTLACISRTRHARSPQRVARAAGTSHSRLRFAHSTRAISAEGCARTGQIALSPAFRALDTHDLRRGLRGQPANRTHACISRTRRAGSPQRVALSVDAVRPAFRL